MIFRPVASFSQSMSPWRATATRFRPDFIKNKLLYFQQYCLKCRTQTRNVIFWRVLRGGGPLPKEAYRMPPSIQYGLGGVYLSPRIQIYRKPMANWASYFLNRTLGRPKLFSPFLNRTLNRPKLFSPFLNRTLNLGAPQIIQPIFEPKPGGSNSALPLPH